MKKYTLMFSILVLAALACNASLPQAITPTAIPTQAPLQNIITPQANSQPQLTEAGVPRINVQEAKAALDSGQAILVDVRSAESYTSGHAAGAISIPLENFENNNISLDKNQWIITYCT
ncbi:MAG: rhodanese-like domain-containing protein [Anaerolineales bacterium]|jgi:3-mercaptopyruvate sulfurtransferase SseA|nr:rhodanese-like domain-containing protein [Anaerolineales bacterium]